MTREEKAIELLKEEQVGPRQETVPARTFQSCWGCVHLHSEGIVFGHNFVEKRYACIHPRAEQDFPKSIFGKGQTIVDRTRDHEVHTPDWCPVLKQKSDGTNSNTSHRG